MRNKSETEKKPMNYKMTKMDQVDWNIELRTNDICLDEYTACEKRKKQDNVTQRIKIKGEAMEERERECEKREKLCAEKEKAVEERESTISAKETKIEDREWMNDVRERANDEREIQNKEREKRNMEKELALKE